MFRFQRFEIDDDQSTMKVGTDAILLAGWTRVGDSRRILDIGTGCGVIALLLAQKSELISSRITGIDVHHPSILQARNNVIRSPWSNRIQIKQSSLEDYRLEFVLRSLQPGLDDRFDLVVSNPPYFDFLKPASERRRFARDATCLRRTGFFRESELLMSEGGFLTIVLPYEQADKAVFQAGCSGLTLIRRTNVKPLPSSPFKRVLLEFAKDRWVRRSGMLPLVDELVVEKVHHQYTAQFADLTRDFYLRFAKDHSG